jgi:hypothetical protein
MRQLLVSESWNGVRGLLRHTRCELLLWPAIAWKLGGGGEMSTVGIRYQEKPMKK